MKWTVLSQRVGPTGRIRSEGRGRAVTKGGTQGIRSEKIEPEIGDRGSVEGKPLHENRKWQNLEQAVNSNDSKLFVLFVVNT